MAHTHEAYSTGARREGMSRLAICVLITAVTMVLEFVAGILTGSLALISDAGHMLSHGASLVISYAAMLIALRPAGGRRTFGLYRAEILAALFNGASLLLLTGFIFWQAYRRFVHPIPIAGGWMLAVAAIGLAVNIATASILRGSARGDLNIKSAFAHMVGDAVSSVVVVAGAIIILWTGWYIVDPLLSVVVCILILIWAYGLIRESVEILLEAAPGHVDVARISERLSQVEGVKLVHDVHVWTITSGLHSMSAHAQIDDMPVSRSREILSRMESILKREFGIAHYTIQFECGRCEECDLKM